MPCCLIDGIIGVTSRQSNYTPPRPRRLHRAWSLNSGCGSLEHILWVSAISQRDTHLNVGEDPINASTMAHPRHFNPCDTPTTIAFSKLTACPGDNYISCVVAVFNGSWNEEDGIEKRKRHDKDDEDIVVLHVRSCQLIRRQRWQLGLQRLWLRLGFRWYQPSINTEITCFCFFK